MKIATNEFKAGLKIELDKQPYVIINNEFVKPGKGQAFNRVKLKNLMTHKVIERTFKSGESVELAEVIEDAMRFLYSDPTYAVFMNDTHFEQVYVPIHVIEDIRPWLMEDVTYSVIIYKGEPISVDPPTFLEMEIVETAPGLRGDTSGRVLKPAITHTGAKVQIPIFIEQGEWIKIDTRNGEYVSRVTK